MSQQNDLATIVAGAKNPDGTYVFQPVSIGGREACVRVPYCETCGGSHVRLRDNTGWTPSTDPEVWEASVFQAWPHAVIIRLSTGFEMFRFNWEFTGLTRGFTATTILGVIHQALVAQGVVMEEVSL